MISFIIILQLAVPDCVGRTKTDPLFPAIFKWATLIEIGDEQNVWAASASHWGPGPGEVVVFNNNEEGIVEERIDIEGWDLCFLRFSSPLDVQAAKVCWEPFPQTSTLVWGVGTSHEPLHINEAFEAVGHFGQWPNWAPTVLFHCPTVGRIWYGDSGAPVFGGALFCEDYYIGPITLAFVDDDGQAEFPEYQCDGVPIEEGGGATPIGNIYSVTPNLFPVWNLTNPPVVEPAGNFVRVSWKKPSNGWALQVSSDLINWIDLPNAKSGDLHPWLGEAYYRLKKL